MYDVSKEFTVEEINLVESSGLTLAEVKDFWARFPDMELDAAIGGTLNEKNNKVDGEITPLVSALQDEVPVETARGEAENSAPAGDEITPDEVPQSEPVADSAAPEGPDEA